VIRLCEAELDVNFYERPEVEYHNGHPMAKVSPKRRHSLVQANFMRIFERCGRALGEIGAEWRFDLGAIDDTITEYLPDVAFISYARLDELDDEAAEEPPGAPDVAVEVRSPGDWPAYTKRKIAKYLACGASLVLYVDPATHAIEAHANDGVRIFQRGETFTHPAAPWLQFDVDEAFACIDRKRRP